MAMPRQPINDPDRDEVAAFIEQHWHSKMVMSRGRSYYPHEHEGFVERRDGAIVGLLTMAYEDEALQVLTLNSTLEGERIGSALMLMSIDDARRRGIRRIWVTTTNDNLPAFGFYQKLGFRMVQVNVGVVDEARQVKPQIPYTGFDGIPVHDEVVLELEIEAFIDAAPPDTGPS